MLSSNQSVHQDDLAHFISYYETCNKCEGKSPKTVKFYSDNLHNFQRYLQVSALPLNVHEITIQILRDYIAHLLTRPKMTIPQAERARKGNIIPLSMATVHCHVRAIRAFFNWLYREGFVSENIGANLKPPRLPKKMATTLTDNEIISILNTFDNTKPVHMRNKTIFTLLIDSGLRIGELINLTINDIQHEGTILHVMGKGQKERIVPLGQNAQKTLNKYLFKFWIRPAHSDVTNIFLSERGLPMTENSSKLMFARLSKKSGVSRLHAHLCRHTFATRYLNNGGDIFTLQRILGHSTLEMVRHYASTSSEQIITQHQRCSPLDRLLTNGGGMKN